MSKEKDFLNKYKHLHIGAFESSLPSEEEAGIIALEISDINNEMTAQEQAFFIAGFTTCIKYLQLQNINKWTI